MESSKYVVIGAGLVGSATAWHLASAGQEVTLLERDVPASNHGSSHGSSRIFRFAYPDETYANLAKVAAPLWSHLERESGQSLLQQVGGVDFGTERNPRQLAAVLDRVGVEHRIIEIDEARERWPQYALDTEVLWQPTAGVVNPAKAVDAMVGLAAKAGAQALTGWQVASVTPASTTGYVVTSSRGEQIHAAEVVVAAGSWLPHILPRLPLPKGFLDALPTFEVRQEQTFHFPYEKPREDADWPTHIHIFKEITTTRMVYALPGGEGVENRALKVALFNGGKVLPSAAQQDGIVDAANRDWVTRYVERHVPGVVPEPFAESTCLFTNTPTEDFVIERVDGITLVSACSGHGAKFAPLTGLLASGITTGNGTVPDAFRVQR
ncbi:FAD-dependent oxidoreductase [Gulosibacter molinativorax]|uniref:FAD-dependent oxidoreductase n=1 Tax=Gulosibacter molinativorax TaxID=256821 RepID=UPI00041D0E7E|nr:FAD-dependent oxidoreductase [Gulosibacter molinativorax]QUY62994.1 Monomeric sarcosine oxidase [Gulosibacter molinativorax]